MLDFRIVKRTNLKQKGELDRLFGVSRIMVSRYMSGESLPRGANRKHISKAIDVLAEYLDNGKLPISLDADDDQRKALLEEIQAQTTSM
jgi:transcriptional regulator with XRE-family HTH domain